MGGGSSNPPPPQVYYTREDLDKATSALELAKANQPKSVVFQPTGRQSQFSRQGVVSPGSPPAPSQQRGRSGPTSTVPAPPPPRRRGVPLTTLEKAQAHYDEVSANLFPDNAAALKEERRAAPGARARAVKKGAQQSVLTTGLGVYGENSSASAGLSPRKSVLG